MKLGRKRSFDKEEVLEKAMRVFWGNGYSGTSLRDLTEALELNKPSLYAAFGNKEKLFEAALNHYQEKYTVPRFIKLTEQRTDPLNIRLKALMTSIAKTITDPQLPMGCLYVNSSCESGGNGMPEKLVNAVHIIKNDSKEYLIGFFKEEQVLGNLSIDSDVIKMSSYLMVVLAGMGVLAKNGSSLEDLEAVIETTAKTLLDPDNFINSH